MFAKAFLVVAVILAFAEAQSQSSHSIDSLQRELLMSKSNLEKIGITLLLADWISESSPQLALEYANESRQLAVKLNSDSLLTRSYLSQANIFLHLGNYPRALQLYQKAIQICEKMGDAFLLANGYGNTGTIYYQLGDHPNALKYYKNALLEFEKVQTKLDAGRMGKKASLLNNIGIIYEEAKDFENAIRYYNEAYALSEKTGDDKMMANVLNNQGTLYRDKGDLKSASRLYHRAMAIRKKNNNKMGVTRSYHNLGQFHSEKMNDLDSATFYQNKAVQLGKEIGSWETVRSSTDELYKLYREKGMFKDALVALELNRQVNDSLFNKESTRRMAQLEMQFEFDRQQSLAKTQQKERELYYWMSGGGLVLLLVIVTLLFFLQRNKTRRSQLEQANMEIEQAKLKSDLAIKDKELATNIMYLLNKNELINSISEKLIGIKDQVAHEYQPSIQKVVLDLQSNLQPELWQEFEFRFQQVHEQFYKKLNEKFPDLSPSERRLCAFLKLNMTTKEISAITHQNAKSIDVARTRLRKKLNLTGTDHNLVSYLSQLETSSYEKAE
jgi:DNA-binding CsgD family transcriptional regulator